MKKFAKRFLLVAIPLAFVFCQVTEKISSLNPGTDTNNNTNDTVISDLRKINVVDTIAYTVSSQKPYFIAMPIRKEGKKYFFVDKDFNRVETVELSDLTLPATLPLDQAHYTVLSNGKTTTLEYSYNVKEFIIFVMDPSWSTNTATAVAATKPTETSFTDDNLLRYMQDINATNFILTGWYNTRGAALEFRSELSTDN